MGTLASLIICGLTVHGPAAGEPAIEGNALLAARATVATTQVEGQIDDRVRGHTIRWTWTAGPVAGTTHEHVFHDDGTVDWRVVEGPQAGHSATESEYAAIRVNDRVTLVSYLAASGYTLTVALDFEDRTLVGIASGESEWYPGRGDFEVVE